MLDISVGFERLAWVGKDFLTWLLYRTECEPAISGDDPIHEVFTSISLGNSLKLETVGERTDRLSFVGNDPSDMKEVKICMRRNGKVVAGEFRLHASESVFSFSTTHDNLQLKGLAVPLVGMGDERVEGTDALAGAITERLFLIGRASEMFNALFTEFLHLRTTEAWAGISTEMREWIEEGIA